MNRKTLLYAGLFILVVIVGGALYILRPTPEASAPLEAVPVEVENQSPTEVVEESLAEATPTEEGAKEEPAAQDEPGAVSGAVVFAISQEQSEVRFTLDELLRDQPNTVVGVTNQVAGEIAVNFDTPSASQVGEITINARTLQTDNDFRNRAINNEILDTGSYELITFVPTEIIGLPESVAVGDTVEVQVVGDLTIRDLTQSVTFNVSVTVVSPTQITGYGSATVLRSDYGLTIPSVPSVANVTDEVLLEIEFTANSN
jgi:polyisoprenoid-binding protein YceI